MLHCRALIGGVGCADVGAMCSGICGGALLVVSVGGGWGVWREGI